MKSVIIQLCDIGIEYDLAVEMWSRDLDYTHYIHYSTKGETTILSELIFNCIVWLCQSEYKEQG